MLYSNFFPSFFTSNRFSKQYRRHSAAKSFPDLLIQPIPDTRPSTPIMGQQQTKISGHERPIHPAFASDNDHTPSRPHTGYLRQSYSSLPPLLPEPPHSAPMTVVPTDQTFSRIDYTPGGALPIPTKAISAKPKYLARKLSQKARRRSTEPESESALVSVRSKRGIEEELDNFEAMISEAESRAGIEPPSPAPQTSNFVKASAFAAVRAKRSTLSDGGIPTPATVSHSGSTPFPLHTRPSHLRRSSSIKSGLASTKSAGRAEREWRAKVASLAYMINSSQEHIEQHRGPVPPKRTPAPNRTPSHDSDEGSGSPGSDAIITPPHPTATQNDKGTPAKSIVSNMSFETLGLYPPLNSGTPRRSRIDSLGTSVRDRKASVPYSISSFYFDSNALTRISTRPSSFAANQMLATIPSDNNSPLSKYSTADDELPRDNDDHPDQVLQVTLPPFENFHVSPPMMFSPLPISPTLTTPTRFDDEKRHSTGDRSSSPSDDDNMTIMSGPYNGNIQTATHRDMRECRIQSLPARRRRSLSPISIPPVVLGDERSRYTPTMNSAKHKSLTVQATPCRQTQGHSPRTPLSPITNYIMTAPIESINWLTTSPGDIRRQSTAIHPYATNTASNSSSPVLSLPPPPPSKSSLRQLNPSSSFLEHATPFGNVHPPPRLVPSRSEAYRLVDPFREVSTSKPRKSEKKPQKKERRATTSTILQIRKRHPQPKVEIVGKSYDDQIDDLIRQRDKMRKTGVDLTPGMETGLRPPKSGLPVDDLQRWLMQTSLGD